MADRRGPNCVGNRRRTRRESKNGADKVLTKALCMYLLMENVDRGEMGNNI